MRKSNKSKVLSALSVAAAVGMYGHVASASNVTINQFYVQAQISTKSNFASGITNINLTSTGNVVNLPVNDYFRFGLSLVVANNPNPVSGDAWDTANQGLGNPAAVTNLGMASVDYVFPSTDTTGADLTPMASGASIGTDPGTNYPQLSGDPEFNSTAAINTNLNHDLGGKGPADVEPGNAGTVGLNFQQFILTANVSTVDQEDPSGNAQFGYFATNSTATSANATTFFTGLSYKGTANGTVTVSPTIYNPGTGPDIGYWVATALGTTSVTTPAGATQITSDPTYAAMQPTVNDTVGLLAPLKIIIGTGGGSPAGPIISLTSGSATQTLPELIDSGATSGNSTHHGGFTPSSAGSNILSVSGKNGSYLQGVVDGINSTGTYPGDGNDYVKINGFTPANDQEIYALKLDDNGTALHGNSTLIADLISDINNANDATFFGTNAGTLASTLSSNPSVASVLPNFDILITIPISYLASLSTTGAPPQYNFGFDFTSLSDPALGTVTTTDLAVIPEPSAALGILSLGAMGLFAYRRRKPTEVQA